MTELKTRNREYRTLSGSYAERTAKARESWTPEMVAYAASLAETFDLARRLREFRRALRLTQAQIAGIIGEDQGDVSRLERGEIDPSTARANRIMERLRAFAEENVGRQRAAVPIAGPALMPVATVAKYLCAIRDEEDAFSGLKLQKLLYYAQGYALVLLGRPLFPERIKAWSHGPVVPQVWHEFKDLESPLPRPEDLDLLAVDPEARAILDRVYSELGQFSAWRLREMTHQEQPWKEAAESKEAAQDDEISLETMRSFFSSQIAG